MKNTKFEQHTGRVWIWGFGVEWKASFSYFQKFYPERKLWIIENYENLDPEFMKQCRSQKILLIDKQYLPDHASYILKATIKPRDIVLKSPGISPLSQDFQVIQDTGASMSTATQLFLAMYRNQIIGVTGSKGKSTTSSLIYSILQQTTDNVYLVGNIGISPLQVLVDHTDSIDHTTIFVYELSSYQLHGLTTSPKYAVITSLFPDHLDWHGGKDPYYADKLNILRFQDYKSGDWCFISHQARGVMQNSVILDSDRGSRIFIQDRILPLLQNLQIWQSVMYWLIGQHNQSNIQLAISVAQTLGCTEEQIEQGIVGFQGLPHRLEYVWEHHGVDWYDDANAATPESVIVALDALSEENKQVDTLFLGGSDRGYDFTELLGKISQLHIQNIVLFPPSGERIYQQIDQKRYTILQTTSMQEAVEFAKQNTEKWKVALLSCGSPSYSLWRNFEEKGDLFQKYITE